MLEAVLRMALHKQDLHTCRMDAAIAWNNLRHTQKLLLCLQQQAEWRATPAAAQQLFGLAASVLKSASVVCSSGFAGRLCSSSSSSRESQFLLMFAMTGISLAVQAIVRILERGPAN
jgi:hypothetical protein